MKLSIIQNRKYFYIFSGALLLISVLSLIAWGLNPGIDFTGGSLLEVKFNVDRPDIIEAKESLAQLDLGDIKIQPAGDTNMILRFRDVDEYTHQQILTTLKDAFRQESDVNVTTTGDDEVLAVIVADPLIEERFESIGPIIGEELKHKAWIAILMAVMMIIAYIAYAFRKVSKPVASWKFGVAAILALVHDIVIVTGLFSILGHFLGVEVDSLFITALLTILGFSVHDTIVVFDRTRENLAKHYSGDFEQVVNDSVNQTISRSINTSFTTLLVLLTLYFFGGATISNFVLALIAGVVIGTYSSIFVASPVIVSWNSLTRKLKSR
ncbi:MAG TPA: protein translocase subunit SecF [Patescibacteria group bacterium]|nr:protein translocase subunit SecF [Patescibacteria group bacterium]